MRNRFACQNLSSRLGRPAFLCAMFVCLCGAALAQSAADREVSGTQHMFRTGKSLETRFAAARQVAAHHVENGRLARAQWWLRRAANYAPDRAAADANRADFQAISRKRVFHPRLRFDIRPTDNINNGADNQILRLGHIILVFPTSALALSGIEYTARADLKWILSRGKTQRTTLDIDLFGRSYSLSQDAQKKAPGARGRDYALTQVALGLTHARQIVPFGRTELRLGAGRVQSGGDPLRQFYRLDVAQHLTLSETSRALVSVQFENQTALRAGQSNARLLGLRYSQAFQRPSGAGWQVTLDAQRYQAEAKGASYQLQQAYVTHHLARPIATLAVSAFAGVTRKHYPEFALSLDGRSDHTIEVGTRVLFTDSTYMGFSPTMTLSAYRTQSNVDLFDTQGASVSFGFQSRF